MDERQRTVLLLYPVGNNDVKFDRACWQRAVVEEGQEQPRAIPFREVTSLIVAALEGASADLLTTDHHAGETRCAIEGDGEPTGLPGGLAGARQDEAGARWRVELPIFRNVIRHVRAREPEGEIVVRCIVTDQRSVPGAWTDQDTHCVPALFARFVAEAAGCAPDLYGRVTIGEPHTLRQNPASFDQMSKAYTNEVMPAFAGAIAGADACYYSAGTGTPAMTFSGATTFGSDARVSFIYKMNGAARVEDIGEFRKLPQQRTLDLLDRSLARFDLALAVDLLDRDDTGFNRHDPRVQRAIGLLKLYRDWEGEYYRQAVDEARSAGLTDAGVSGIAATLAALPSRRDRENWPDYWQTAMFSTALRLRADVARNDLPEFIDRIIHFRDLSLLYARTWFGWLTDISTPEATVNELPAANRAGLPPKGIRSFSGESGTSLINSRINHPQPEDRTTIPNLRPWWEMHTLVQFLAGTIRDLRNAHVHKLVIYDAEVLNDQVRYLLRDDNGQIPVAFEQRDTVWFLLRLVETCVAMAPRHGGALPSLDDLCDEVLGIPVALAGMGIATEPREWRSATLALEYRAVGDRVFNAFVNRLRAGNAAGIAGAVR